MRAAGVWAAALAAALVTVTAPVAASAAAVGGGSAAEDGFEVIASVTTRDTRCSGERVSSWSRQETIHAPAGHYINKNRVQVHWQNAIGSENREELIYSNDIRISSEDPDLVFPTTLQYRVFARSGKGHCGSPGRSEIRIIGKFSRVLG